MVESTELAADPAYDLTQVLSPFLDLHLVFPLIQFIEEREMYSPEGLLQAKLDLLRPTNMIDYAKDIYCQLNNTDDAPAEFDERRDTILDIMASLKDEAKVILDLIEDQEEFERLQTNKQFTRQHLAEAYDIHTETLDALYKYAKFQYECGIYGDALVYLTCYCQLFEDHPSKVIPALWGKFGSEILMMDWDAALESLNKLRDLLDGQSFAAPLEQLQQRSWLLHWALFVFFNHPDGRDSIIDFCFQQRYMEAIQTNCPWLLRYLTTAVIINKRRRNVLKDLIKVIQQEGNTYRDPIVDFFECLYVNFDFEGAHQKLKECESVLVSDFFLVYCHEEFMENARQFIFEIYCRIHQKIGIGMLAEKLGMEEDHAERWIVDLIRAARLDAKIDSQSGVVIMGTQSVNIHQQVIEKTKDLVARSHVLANNLDETNESGDRKKGGRRDDRGDRHRGDRDNRERGGRRDNRERRDRY